MTDANQSDAVVVPEGWIKHDGGPMPVDRHAAVKVIFPGESFDAAEETEYDFAGMYWRSWRAIIAYKPEPGAGGGKG